MSVNNKITFYSNLPINLNLDNIDSIKNRLNEKGFQYREPSVFLIRDDNWNDYGYVTNFFVIYKEKMGDFKFLGITKIIGNFEVINNGRRKKTILPDMFKNLDKEKFFSRGDHDLYQHQFYKEIEKIDKETKDNLLDSLNDVSYKGIRRNNIPNELKNAYDRSLFRDSIPYSLKSDHAKDSLSLLEEIRNKAQNDKFINMLLFGSSVTVLEDYLNRFFTLQVLASEKALKSFLEREENLKKNLLDSLMSKSKSKIIDFLKERAEERINKISFHNTNTVHSLFKKILNIEINLSIFSSDIKMRNDIFHRNGITVRGDEINISREEVQELVEKIENFIKSFEKKYEATSKHKE